MRRQFRERCRLAGNRASRVAIGRQPSGSAVWLIVGIAVAFVAFFVIGKMSKDANEKQVAQMEAETVSAVPKVHVVRAVAATFHESGVLPGTIGAIQYASIYSRVDGYLKRRLVDIGDQVKTGQLLAEIDTPTLDQQLAQAKEDLAQARAVLETAKATWKEAQAKDEAAKAQVDKAVVDEEFTAVTAKRWVNMASRGAVSLQSRDEKVTADKAQSAQVDAAKAEKQASDEAVNAAASQINTAKAAVAAQLANVKRLEAQQAFKYVRASFNGIITLRKVDPGDLITAGSQSNSLELFQMGQIDKLRIYVNAPQTVATYLKPGQPAQITLPELPGRVFNGVVTNVSGALDPQTRTLQTEIHMDNEKHTLLPGMYAQVKLTVPRPDPWVRIPGTCLVPKSDGTYVAIADGDKARFQKVTIGRDFGDDVEVSDGLHGNEQVIISPPVDLTEGEAVKPLSESEKG